MQICDVKVKKVLKIDGMRNDEEVNDYSSG